MTRLSQGYGEAKEVGNVRMKTLFLVSSLFLSMFCIGADSGNRYSRIIPSDVVFSSVWQAWDVAQKEFVDPEKLNNKKMIVGMIRGLLSGMGDSHCVFFTTEEFDKFLDARKEGSVTTEIFLVSRRNGESRKVGYLKIKGFYEKTAEEAVSVAVEFKRAGVSGIILDFRQNTGGRLVAARGVCGIFLGPNKVVLKKTGRRGTIEVLSEGAQILSGIPIVCLVDRHSASASEAVAGALRDHLGVKLIGARTHGKGSIQESREIDNGVILITTYHWTTPKGVVVNGCGLEPDVAVVASPRGGGYKDDAQLARALRELFNE